MKKQNQLPKLENSVTSEILKKDDPTNATSPLCPSNCKSCGSEHLPQIHNLRLKQRKKFREISDIMLKKHNFKISSGALCRHFKNYEQYIRNMTNAEIIEYTNNQVDFRSKHMSQLNDLIESMFIKLAQNWGTITPSIDSLEKLVKLRYQVLEGKIDADSFEEQIRILIQNAENINNVASQTKIDLNQPAPAPEGPAS